MDCGCGVDDMVTECEARLRVEPPGGCMDDGGWVGEVYTTAEAGLLEIDPVVETACTARLFDCGYRGLCWELLGNTPKA